MGSVTDLARQRSAVAEADKATIETLDLESALTKTREVKFPIPSNPSADFVDVLLLIATFSATKHVTEIGQALLIDATRFVAAYFARFEEASSAEMVTILETAIRAYIVPQLEFFLPQMRRAKIEGREEDEPARWRLLCALLRQLNLATLSDELLRGAEEYRLLS